MGLRGTRGLRPPARPRGHLIALASPALLGRWPKGPEGSWATTTPWPMTPPPATRAPPHRGVRDGEETLSLIRPRVLAAVHQQVLAGDVARVRAAQEGTGRAEFLGRAEAAGRVRLGAGSVLLVIALAALGGARLVGAAQAIGVERAGQQAVDGHTMTDGDTGHAGHEAGETAPRAVAQPQYVDRRLHRTRRDVHDAAEAALHHAVDRRLDELDGRQHVGVDRLDPVVALPVAEITRRRATRVVDDDVGLRTGGEHLLTTSVGRDVDGDRRHLHAGLLADLLRRRLELGLGAGVDDEVD